MAMEFDGRLKDEITLHDNTKRPALRTFDNLRFQHNYNSF